MVALDATIAGYAHEEGRALILCVNKWDVSGEKGKRKFTEDIRDELKFLDYAPAAFISAKTGAGVDRLFGMIRNAFDSASKRVTTGELNRFVEMLDFDRDIKVYYMTQASVRPPYLHRLHRQSERPALLNRALPDQPTPQTLRLRRHAHRTKNQATLTTTNHR